MEEQRNGSVGARDDIDARQTRGWNRPTLMEGLRGVAFFKKRIPVIVSICDIDSLSSCRRWQRWCPHRDGALLTKHDESCRCAVCGRSHLERVARILCVVGSLGTDQRSELIPCKREAWTRSRSGVVDGGSPARSKQARRKEASEQKAPHKVAAAKGPGRPAAASKGEECLTSVQAQVRGRSARKQLDPNKQRYYTPAEVGARATYGWRSSRRC